MTLGISISRAVMVLFFIFTQIIIQICTVTHGHGCKTKNRGHSKVVSFDSEGLSYSTKVPSDLFLTHGIMFKKYMTRRKMTDDPAVWPCHRTNLDDNLSKNQEKYQNGTADTEPQSHFQS